MNPIAPDQRTPSAERTPQWYADNLRYISRFYNIPLNNSFIQEYQGKDPSQKVGDIFEDNPVQYMLRMMLYYLGRQPNLDYNHIAKTTTSGNIMPNWIKGQNVHNLVSFLRDRISDLLKSARFSATSMSEVSISERKELLELLMLQMELRGEFSQIEQQFGMNMNLANGKKFEFKEDIDYWFQNGYVDLDSEIDTVLATNFWYSQGCIPKFLQAGMHACVTGACGAHHYVMNGKSCMDIVMPHQMIIDRRVDDEYNRRARFIGIIKPYVVDEIFTLWPNDDKKQIETIRSMSKNNNTGIAYNTQQNITWWSYGNDYAGNVVTTLTGYWITYNDTGKKTFTNSYGIEKLRNAKEGETGDDMIEDVAKGTIIGNAFVTNYGFINNVAEDFYNKNKPLLPVRVFLPDMTLGESRSIVSRIHQLQDERDMYKFKIKEAWGRAKGRVAVIRGDKLGNALLVKELEEDLSSLGIAVVVSSGEAAALGGEDNGRVVEPLDMTVDPNVVGLIQIIGMIDEEMKRVATVSDIAMSQQQVYVGLGTQQNAMQNSSGSSSLYASFMDWVQQNIQYAVDVQRNIIISDPSDSYEPLIGRRGIEYVKTSDKIGFNNPLVRIIVDPVIPKESKDRMIAIAQAVAQNQGIDILDFVKIEKGVTYEEIVKYLEYSIDKKERKEEQRAAMQQMLDQINQQNTEMSQENNVMNQAAARQRAQQPQPQK